MANKLLFSPREKVVSVVSVVSVVVIIKSS